MTTQWGVEGPPRLSPSIAKVLLERSPRVAWAQHRLGGNKRGPDTAAMNEGRLIERLLLGVGPEIVVIRNPRKDKKGNVIEPIEYEDGWRSDAIKEMRDAAKKAGKLPVLPGGEAEYQAVVDGWRSQLAQFEVELTGQSQVRMEWESEGVPCSGIIDHLIIAPTFAVIYDVKGLECASQQAITRAVAAFGYDTQGAAYVEAVETRYPHLAGRVTFKLICGEKTEEADYSLNVVPYGGTMRELGERKWRRAKRIWGECLRTGEFPGYPGLPIEANSYQLAAEEEAQMPEADNDTAPFMKD